MSLYYDRAGNPTDLAGFTAAQADFRVAETQVGSHWVSTVWLGVCSNAIGAPLIFETMVFDADGHEVDSERYATEDDAFAGHQRMIQKWSTS